MDGLNQAGAEAELDGAERSNAYFERIFADQRVMAILRGMSPEETVGLCERAWGAGIEVVEVTVQSLSAVESLRAAAAAADRQGHRIGAGTVTTTERVAEARHAGASFSVAPGLDVAVARACLDAGLAHMPGVATASEVQSALACGFRWLKVFPAAQLTAGWVKAMLAPFPEVCFVATGGVDALNAPELLAAGAKVVAVGSALRDPRQIDLLAGLQPGAGR